jgi:hypothetical protein
VIKTRLYRLAEPSDLPTDKGTPRMLSRFVLLALALVGVACSPASADPPPESGSQLAALSGFPCEVDQVLQSKCRPCHSEGGLTGTPFHFTSPDVVQQVSRIPASGGKQIRQLIDERIHGVGNPMPPATMPQLAPEERGILENWLRQGAPSGSTCSAMGIGGQTGSGGGAGFGGGVIGGGGAVGIGGSVVGGGGAVGFGGSTVGAGGAARDGDSGVYVAPGPNDCDTVEIRARQDASGAPFPVPVGTSELYQCFSYNVPPGATNQAISFKPIIEHPNLIHHWLLYKMATPQTNGVTSGCLGTHLDGQLLAGYAPGAGEWLLPEDVGVDIGSGNFLLEIHYNNYGTTNETDRSGVAMCRAKVARKNTATISWLGNDTFGFATPGIPPATADAPIYGACKPNITQPIHILKSWPHMHKHGRRMEVEIHRANGTVEPFFDKPFDFNAQIQYDTPGILNPGDWIKTTCHFANDSPGMIGFGEATTVEMCYDFTLAYPANALVAGIGVHSNVCLGQP